MAMTVDERTIVLSNCRVYLVGVDYSTYTPKGEPAMNPCGATGCECGCNEERVRAQVSNNPRSPGESVSDYLTRLSSARGVEDSLTLLDSNPVFDGPAALASIDVQIRIDGGALYRLVTLLGEDEAHRRLGKRLFDLTTHQITTGCGKRLPDDVAALDSIPQEV
jgi:hypothetical protein